MTENTATEHDTPEPGQPTHNEIAERAYFISEDEQGDEVENWLRAERELTKHEQGGAQREPDRPPAAGRA